MRNLDFDLHIDKTFGATYAPVGVQTRSMILSHFNPWYNCKCSGDIYAVWGDILMAAMEVMKEANE
jgi:hypothetical protein